MQENSHFDQTASVHDAIEYIPTAGATCDTYRVKYYGKWHFLKQLKPQYASSTSYQLAFRKEFETGYSLEHPNLVRYLSLSDDGILMEYVDGETLTAFLQSHPDYFRKRKNSDKFLEQMLSVLQYLHEHQVLHLDLKPDNILITRINHDVKLIDLGGCYTDCFTDTTAHTDAYAAPEQLSVLSQQGTAVSESTDLYALGCILRQLPCGNHYQSLISRCTQPQPADRFQSAEEMFNSYFVRSPFLSWHWLLLVIGLLLLIILLFRSYSSSSLEPTTAVEPTSIVSADSPSSEESSEVSVVFRSSQDVMRYVLSRRFHQGNYTLAFRTDGIYMNGRCMSFAPVVDSFDGSQAIIAANNPTQGFFRFRIDATQATATDMSSGDVYTAQ
ncbi:MAG: serine/threonine protein kinase [Prevotella sp.]|nr:serine/threonine protein kinase [Prevotella sp.]